jgi:DNA polymerase-4
MTPVIFHLDMGAFFAAIEQRDFPELRGKPVIVGGTGNRGVVSTASYEARPFGVHSAMPTYRARQLCPQGVFLPPRGGVYSEVSKQLMEILGRYSPDVEPLSLDEAFLDMTGSEQLFGPPATAAERILVDIETELQLTASVGVAPNKYIAKVASDMNKPRGLTVCPPGEEKAFLAPLPVERIWGVGPKSVPKLHALGMRKIGDVARWDPEELQRQLGNSFGEHIWRLANGLDARRVERDRVEKSMGGERTFSADIRGVDAVRERLLPLCDHVAARLRRHGMRAGGIRLKVKYATFKSVTRQKKLKEPVCDAESFRAVLNELMGKLDLDRPIRLVGLAGYALVEDEGQAGLFDGVTNERETLERTMDLINEKYGRGSVKRAGAVRLGPGQPGKD